MPILRIGTADGMGYECASASELVLVAWLDEWLPQFSHPEYGPGFEAMASYRGPVWVKDKDGRELVSDGWTRFTPAFVYQVPVPLGMQGGELLARLRILTDALGDYYEHRELSGERGGAWRDEPMRTLEPGRGPQPLELTGRPLWQIAAAEMLTSEGAIVHGPWGEQILDDGSACRGCRDTVPLLQCGHCQQWLCEQCAATVCLGREV